MSKKIKVVPDLSLLLMTALVASTASINSTWAETEENQQHLMTSDDILARGDSEDKLKLKADDSHAHSKESTASRAKNAEKEASHVKSSSASKVSPEVRAEIEAAKKRLADLEKNSSNSTFVEERARKEKKQAGQKFSNPVKEIDRDAILKTEEGKRAKADAAKIRENADKLGIKPESAVYEKINPETKKFEKAPHYEIGDRTLYPIDSTERDAAAKAKREKAQALKELKENRAPEMVGESHDVSGKMTKKPSKLTQLKNKIKGKLSGKKPVNADSDARVKEAAEKKARQSEIDDLHAKGNEQRKQNINKEALDNNKKMMRAEADAKNVAKAKQASEAAKATEKSIAQVAGNEAEQVAEKTSGTVGKAAGVAGKSESKLSKFGGFLGRLLK